MEGLKSRIKNLNDLSTCSNKTDAEELQSM